MAILSRSTMHPILNDIWKEFKDKEKKCCIQVTQSVHTLELTIVNQKVS